MAVEVAFQSQSVTPLSKFPEKAVVKWALLPTNVDLGDYEFYLDRARAPDQDKDVLNQTIDDLPAKPTIFQPTVKNLHQLAGPISALDYYQYIDFTANFFDFYKTDYYRVRCRRISTQEEISSNIFTFKGDLDLVGLYIVDEYNFLLTDTTGAPSYVYKRRSSGVLCECYDVVMKKRKISHCTVCFGTNWRGGFYKPVLTYIDFNPSTNAIQIQDWGATQPNDIMAQLSNWPRIEPGDIVRELRTQRMWRVNNVRDTEKRRIPMLQFAQFAEVNSKDIEYSIPYDECEVSKILLDFEAERQKLEF